MQRLWDNQRDKFPWLRRKNFKLRDLPNFQQGKKIYGHIYITTFPNGKVYVGQCSHIINSSAEKSYFGSGTLYNRAEVKYGKENLNKEILWLCYDLEEYNLTEEYFIWVNDACNKDVGYNILPTTANWHQGGINPASLPEVRAKISKAQTGKKHNEQARLNMGLSHLGSKRNKKTKRKMSQSMIGNSNTKGYEFGVERSEIQRQAAYKGWKTRHNNKSRFRCVKKTKHRGWRMRIAVDNVKYDLYFKTEIEAAKAYNELAIIAFGDKAILNKIED